MLKVLNNLIEAQTCSVMNRCLSERFCFGIWLFPGCRDLPPLSSSCEWHQIKLDKNVWAQQTFIFFSLRSSVCIHYVATVWFWTEGHLLWLFLWSQPGCLLHFTTWSPSGCFCIQFYSRPHSGDCLNIFFLKQHIPFLSLLSCFDIKI